jgi:ribosomal protein L29
MPKAVVTADVVAAAAAQLVAAGQEPSLIAVQAAIGGGSFSTVKRYLDPWRAERAALATVAVPAAVTGLGGELTVRLWQQAVTQADERVARIRAEAAEQTAVLATALDAAETTIERLETEQAALIVQLAAAEAQATTATAAQRAAEVVAQTATAQAETLHAHVADLQAQLATAQVQAAAGQAAQLAQAQLTGELGVLRERLDAQQVMIERLGPKRKPAV